MFIVEFSDVPHSSRPSESNTFEIILYETSNKIKVNYLDVTSRGVGKTSAGIENSDGSVGLKYTHLDTAGRYTNLYVVYSPPTSSGSHSLYFPHVATRNGWQTEICVVNTDDSQVNGTFRAYSDQGDLLPSSISVVLPPNGRRQVNVAAEFASPQDIGYIAFASDTENLVGYTRFFIQGKFSVSLPAVSSTDTANIYIPHIASNTVWTTGIALLNTTSSNKNVTLQFNNGTQQAISLGPGERFVGLVRNLPVFGGHPQPQVGSGVVRNASGVVGFVLFGSGYKLSGTLLTGRLASDIYYPHIASNAKWYTGLVTYNPNATASNIQITCYREDGLGLQATSGQIRIDPGGKYVGVFRQLGLPTDTDWMRIHSTAPVAALELFGNEAETQLAGYSVNGIGKYQGVFPKVKTSGTGIALVNTEDSPATVTLTAYSDSGSIVASLTRTLTAHEKIVDVAGHLFQTDITQASYIAYSSTKRVVGFQLNVSTDGMMLDALPAM